MNERPTIDDCLLMELPKIKDRAGNLTSVHSDLEIPFEVRDGENIRKVLLNRPYNGLYVPPGIWAQEQGFSSGTVCLVFASHYYEESDYIRDFSDFKAYIHANR